MTVFDKVDAQIFVAQYMRRDSHDNIVEDYNSNNQGFTIYANNFLLNLQNASDAQNYEELNETVDYLRRLGVNIKINVTDELPEEPSFSNILLGLTSYSNNASFAGYVLIDESLEARPTNIRAQRLVLQSSGIFDSNGAEYSAIIHELLHTLGARHPGSYEYGVEVSDSSVLNSIYDNIQFTSVSYAQPYTFFDNNTPNNNLIEGDYLSPQSFMIGDYIYLKSTFGLPQLNAGNNIYDFYVEFSRHKIHNFSFSIYDEGGTDVVNFGLFSGTHTNIIDMGNGRGSSIGGVENNFFIGFDTEIETIHASSSKDILYAGAWKEAIYMDGGDDVVFSGGGQDKIYGDGGHDRLYGGAATDTNNNGIYGEFYFDENNNEVHENSNLEAGSSSLASVKIYGGAGLDHIVGGREGDELYGGADNDVIFGSVGNDLIYGDDFEGLLQGNDILHGQGDNDGIFGGKGHDEIYGGSGNDQIFGGEGFDALYGHTGEDIIHGENENDYIYGEEDSDDLFGGSGNDSLYGGNGNDEIFGGADQDTLYGGLWADTLEGGSGNDLLYGEHSNDVLRGGGGVDHIYGGVGNDQMYGGAGGDKFFFRVGEGSDTIFDFSRSEGDMVLINSYVENNATYTISGNSTKTIFNFTWDGGSSTLTVHGMEYSPNNAWFDWFGGSW